MAISLKRILSAALTLAMLITACLYARTIGDTGSKQPYCKSTNKKAENTGSTKIKSKSENNNKNSENQSSIYASRYIFGKKGGRTVIELLISEKGNYTLLCPDGSTEKFKYRGLSDNVKRVGNEYRNERGVFAVSYDTLEQTPRASVNVKTTCPWYSYTATLTIPKQKRGGRLNYRLNTTDDGTGCISLWILDQDISEKTTDKYLKKLTDTYDEYYEKYEKWIINDYGKDYGKKDPYQGRQPPYYDAALNAAENTEDSFNRIIGEARDKGYVKSYGRENLDRYVINWSFGAVSVFDFRLSDIITYDDPGNNIAVDKPVIYLYPKKKTDVTVRLDTTGMLTTLYPIPDKMTSSNTAEWKMTARPDGILKDKTGQTYNYLYWEGQNNDRYDFSAGFCIKGSDTAEFLENALKKLGLTRREANEFIVYWLPQMESNPYNVISFQTRAYTDNARLKITPKPDIMIRVFMAWCPYNKKINIPKQSLKAPERKGFTVVEWGGSRCKPVKPYSKPVGRTGNKNV